MKLYYDYSKLFVGMLVFSSFIPVRGREICLDNLVGLQSEMNGDMSRPFVSSKAFCMRVQGNSVEAEPVIELDYRTFNQARGQVGQKVEVGKVHVKAVDLSAEVQIVPSGSVEGIYTTDVQSLPAGSSEIDMTIFYEAKKIGKDEGRLYFMLGEDILEQINLKGLATDPAIPPTVKLEPTVLEDFKTEVGTPVSATLSATLVGLPSSVNVKMVQDEPAFSCNTGLLYYSVKTHQLKFTFNPKKAGTFEATVVLTNEFFEPIEVKLKGTATEKEDVKPDVEGDQLPLSYESPVSLLNEDFNKGLHNKPLSLEGWKNVAAIGQRAWWGYTFPEYDTENAGECVAKVTPYDSKVEYGEETECQMLLVTPPLNYKDAASKIFTFRVMGTNMTEKMPDKFMFCSLQDIDGALYAEPVEGVVLPSNPNENGEWIDYHVDLSEAQVEDVFHLGFLFYGMRGTVSSTSYFIDDVSWGRTDLPQMIPGKREVYLGIEPGQTSVSEIVTVETKNLKYPVKLSLGGRDKGQFELSSETLSTKGGAFALKFKGAEEGQYETYVKLSSRGAATQYVAFFASVETGVESLVMQESSRVEVLDASGRCLLTTDGASFSRTFQSVAKGRAYLLRITDCMGTRVRKVVR